MSQAYFCYSALIGDYDLPPNVIEPDPRIQYVLFADQLTAAPAPWTLVKVENYFRDRKITSGFLKSNPEMLFGHDARVVWLDGNARDIRIDRNRIDCWLAAAPVAVFRHRIRSTVADELVEVLRTGIEDDISSARLMAQMRADGFADDRGLSAAMLLIRDLADHRVRRADRQWWEAILSGARRDQISFDFALWSAGLVGASIDVDWRVPNPISTRIPHANDAGRALAPRAFSPEEIERRWRAFDFSTRRGLPANHPKPPYYRERWSVAAIEAIRDINAAVIASGNPLHGNCCYFHEQPISARTPPDPRLSWQRQVLRAASGAGCNALEIGFDAGHAAVVMLDANPLMHLTSIEGGSRSYAQPCAAIVGRRFAGRFSLRADQTKSPLAQIGAGTARQFDIIRIGGGPDGPDVADDFAWVMRHAAPGCCIVVDDAYLDPTEALIAAAIAAGQLRVAALPIPRAGENRVFFKTGPAPA